MKAEQRAECFKKELKELLKKYKTELEMQEISRSYQGCEYTMMVYLQSNYNESGELVDEEVEIDLGTYFSN